MRARGIVQHLVIINAYFNTMEWDTCIVQFKRNSGGKLKPCHVRDISYDEYDVSILRGGNS